MDNRIPTSFIPKGTIKNDLRPRRQPVGIITVVALLLLAIALIYFAGLYGYRYLVFNEINRPCVTDANGVGRCGLQASFDKETKELQRDKLEQLKRLDTKLKNGMSVLNRHVAFRPLFDLLGALTVQNIQYKKFEFNKDKGNMLSGLVTISGLAKSYEDIAYQQQIFTKDAEAKKKIRNFSFSDFGSDKDNRITFKLMLTVDETLLSYVDNQSQ